MKIGCFGLGSMGYGMAASLLRAGHDVLGLDPNAAAADRLRGAGGLAGTLAEHAATLDAVVIVVLNAAQTRDVLFGPAGIAEHLRPGAAVMACATVPPAFAREMAGLCAAQDLPYLDAPISGGSVKAAAGQLSVMASGSDAAFAALRPVLDATAATVFELGADPGAGSAMKAINQMLAGIHIAAMGEALTFGLTQGVAPAQAVEVIAQCAGTSWMFENRGPHVATGDYTPHSAINIWPKDLGIVLDIAAGAKFGAPLTAAALQQFLAAAGSGLGAEDDAAIAKIYARNAGLTLPGDKP
jgi:3-hydroxyisobutyrate dehydrogenase-like beta-hydroxyacid dehydrogenase